MQGGFFKKSELAVLNRQPSLVPKCSACRLYLNGCLSPKMKVDGLGKRGILILAEASGYNEDLQGKPLVGRTGQFLEQTLQKFGVDMRRDCWLYNSVICRPSGSAKDNRSPTFKEIGYCRPNVIRTILDLKPTVIIPLGSAAVQSLMGWLWLGESGGGEKQDKRGNKQMGVWDGWRIPCQEINCWLCPTWHPSHVMRQDDRGGRSNEVLQMFFEQHLEAAVNLQDRPWIEVPDYARQVRCILDHEEAARAVRSIIQANRPTAYDYETTHLKPDHPDAAIFSCALSNGKDTISFPWHGQAVEAMREFLLSNVPKLNWNEKFELRWSKRILGIWPRNGIYDGMIGTHVLDNRSNITSAKFQAWVRLGFKAWDAHVTPYLIGKGSNSANRIRELDLPSLLKYGGLDALVEYKIDKLQMKELGIEP